jgi:hypothetical protein
VLAGNIAFSRSIAEFAFIESIPERGREMTSSMRQLTEQELDHVNGGTGCYQPCPPPPCYPPPPPHGKPEKEKGNNGFGNGGGDGSPNGKQDYNR